ncbi:MAG: hypothetical protein KatS3mg068_0893 [Candidatus Sericytochromatia bacterium]|nr:MAG: hypothetical protein KatS3mg068_0893 [Candidatus Sericytochromatia bacterium]
MENLIEKTKKELLDIAKELGLKRLSKLSKVELIALIEKHNSSSSIEKNFDEEKTSEETNKLSLVSEGHYEKGNSYAEM